MSRNFELLRRADKQQEWFLAPTSRSRGSGNGNRHPFNLQALTQQEEIKLVQRVFLVPSSSKPRTVVFCGVDHDDGSNHICARAAEVLAAQAGRSVCMVDAYLHSPSLHEYFGVENLRGLTDAVVEECPVKDFAKRLAGDNLWLITAGSRPSQLLSLLRSERLRTRMTELREEFDYVLIDAPPVNLYADATLLGQMSDGVVLVLESNSTRRGTARKATESLAAARVPLLGAVLNNRTFPIPETLYRKL